MFTELACSSFTMGSANRYNFSIVFFVALGSFTYGFNSAIIGSVLGLDSFLSYFKLILTGDTSGEGNRLIGGKIHILP